MAYAQPPRSGPTNRPGPRWTTIAIYAGLFLLVLWLKYSTEGGGAQQSFPQNRPSTAPTLPPPPAAQPDGSHDESVSRNRVARNAPADDEDSMEGNGGRTSSPVSSQRPQPAETNDRRGDQDDALVVHNVRVLDEDRRVVYRGDVDLGPTLKRIESGRRLRFSHDGIVFENRERRLPSEPSGYYREYVVPTPGDNGPGAQRVVLGAGGEVYYSSDHYRSFRRVR